MKNCLLFHDPIYILSPLPVLHDYPLLLGLYQALRFMVRSVTSRRKWQENMSRMLLYILRLVPAKQIIISKYPHYKKDKQSAVSCLVSFKVYKNSKSQARLRLAGSVKSVKPYLKMLTVWPKKQTEVFFISPSLSKVVGP